MRPDIISKLTKEFSLPIRSERQVVYILVELRKLLEQAGTLHGYEILNLCCDWVVHPKLSWNKTAKKILRFLDEYETEYRRQSVGIRAKEFPELSAFFQHESFRREIVAACQANDVPADAILSDDWWRSFLAHYTEVVKDCPLEVSGDDTQHVKRVTAQALSNDMTSAVMPSKQFGIWWEWSLNGEGRTNGVMSFF